MNEALFNLWLNGLMTLLALSLLICFVRLYLGPDVPNRTVAFDLIAVHAVGIFALFAVQRSSEVLLEGAIITAVLGFLGTVMLGRFLERGKPGK
ncbi:MAG: cation transporter [Chloroflexi bacterium]|nr:cation transporter [Chloroflexota bacterium]